MATPASRTVAHEPQPTAASHDGAQSRYRFVLPTRASRDGRLGLASSFVDLSLGSFGHLQVACWDDLRWSAGRASLAGEVGARHSPCFPARSGTGVARDVGCAMGLLESYDPLPTRCSWRTGGSFEGIT